MTSRRELAAVVTRRYPESPRVILINANSMNNYNTRKMNIITLDDFCSGHGLTGRALPPVTGPAPGSSPDGATAGEKPPTSGSGPSTTLTEKDVESIAELTLQKFKEKGKGA